MKKNITFALVVLTSIILSSNLFAGSMLEEKAKLLKLGIKCESEQNDTDVDGNPEWLCSRTSGTLTLELKTNRRDGGEVETILVSYRSMKNEDLDPVAKKWVRIVAEEYDKKKVKKIIKAFEKGERFKEETDQCIFVNKYSRFGNYVGRELFVHPK